MLTTSDFRKGLKILLNKQPYIVIDFQHHKRAMRGGLVRTRVKNLLTGLIHEETFRSDEKFEKPDLQYREMQYLYNDGEMYNFLDQKTADEVALSEKQIEEVKDYLKEQIVYKILYFEGKPVTIAPPEQMELEVTDAPPGVKGDTAQGAGTKPVTLETGLVIQAPLFVETGDIIRINTEQNKYLERAEKKR